MAEPIGESKILTYKDVVIRKSDLDILDGSFFLNDRIIDFYFRYLYSSHFSEDILLTSPSDSFWIATCPLPDVLNDFLQPFDLHNKKLVIFPVNNSEDINSAEGGNHWSLLVFYRDANVFVHHDSCNGTNKRPAEKIYTAINGFIGSSSSTSAATYVECSESPQQTNEYDCGLYVTAIAKTLCSWYDEKKALQGQGEGEGAGQGDGDGLWYSAVKEEVNSSSVARMRSDISDIINCMMVLEVNQPTAR